MKPLGRVLFSCLIALAYQAFFIPDAFAQNPGIDAYRRFALTREGNAERGKQYFNEEQRVACSKCHSVDGSASKAGPDLQAAGDAFGRRDLVEAVLAPSATIAPGYNAVLVETKSGETFQGVLKQSSEASVQLMGADGKLVTIVPSEIKSRTSSPISLMPEGLQAALSTQEFTDLIEYLTTLKQPASLLTAHRGLPAEIPSIAKPVGLTPFFAGDFKLPPTKQETGLTAFHQIPNQLDAYLVLHQKGLIWRVQKRADGEERSVFADLSSSVFWQRGPNGLLDLAFHPNFSQNRKYYLFYQVFEDGKAVTRVVEKEFDAEGKVDSGKPERLIIKFVSVAEDHAGGCLAFGPDGFLYLTMGDTGPHNDPNGHAQNLHLLLGKMLRIDVDHREGENGYSIPADNPFLHDPEIRPEIWAYGFRNPWRFSFDRLTKELWLADVGQDRVEEVDLVRRGGNYGWNVYEAFEPFSNQFRQEGRTFISPVFAYRRKYGNSITGGYVYRGDRNSPFFGAYICGDYNSKRIFALRQEEGALVSARQLAQLPQRLSTFGEDESGRLFAVGYEGMIYLLDFTQAETGRLRPCDELAGPLRNTNPPKYEVSFRISGRDEKGRALESHPKPGPG